MKLIKYTHQDGQEEWFWINKEEVCVSPRYGNKQQAEQWYDLHTNWLESPAIIR